MPTATLNIFIIIKMFILNLNIAWHNTLMQSTILNHYICSLPQLQTRRFREFAFKVVRDRFVSLDSVTVTNCFEEFITGVELDKITINNVIHSVCFDDVRVVSFGCFVHSVSSDESGEVFSFVIEQTPPVS